MFLIKTVSCISYLIRYHFMMTFPRNGIARASSALHILLNGKVRH